MTNPNHIPPHLNDEKWGDSFLLNFNLQIVEKLLTFTEESFIINLYGYVPAEPFATGAEGRGLSV